MRSLLSNIWLVISVAFFFCMASLSLSLCISEPEWFQASGAVVTVAGVLLAARKLIRLGLKEYIQSKKVIDLGHIQQTPEEIERDSQFDLDIESYRWSIVLLVVGTFIWAYGGIVLRASGIQLCA